MVKVLTKEKYIYYINEGIFGKGEVKIHPNGVKRISDCEFRIETLKHIRHIENT